MKLFLAATLPKYTFLNPDDLALLKNLFNFSVACFKLGFDSQGLGGYYILVENTLGRVVCDSHSQFCRA